VAIEAVVFDLGGTLIEYAGRYQRWPDLETPGFKAAYAYLNQQGVSLPAFAAFRQAGLDRLPQRWQQAMDGTQNLRVADLLAEVARTLATEQGREALEEIDRSWLEEAAERYQAAVRAQARPIEGAQATLAQVKERGYKVGLISNTMFTGVAHQEDLKRFGLDHFFDTMLFSAEVNKWKPNPAPFRHVLEELETTPATAVFVGDDPAGDVVGGQRAGMRVVHYQSSQRFRMPDGVEPDAQIHKLEEVLSVLARWDGDGHHPG
jgi:putative hydrolase of the HAD superfamily